MIFSNLKSNFIFFFFYFTLRLFVRSSQKDVLALSHCINRYVSLVLISIIFLNKSQHIVNDVGSIQIKVGSSIFQYIIYLFLNSGLQNLDILILIKISPTSLPTRLYCLHSHTVVNFSNLKHIFFFFFFYFILRSFLKYSEKGVLPLSHHIIQFMGLLVISIVFLKQSQLYFPTWLRKLVPVKIPYFIFQCIIYFL